MNDVRTLLHDSGLSHSFWAEAASYSIATRNLIPSRQHPGIIPLESFTQKRQDVLHLRVFGAKCWAKIPTLHGVQVNGGSKLDPRGLECKFLGYAGGNGNYKVQDISSQHVFISHDIIFEEGQPHRTSSSVEENLPLFDTMETPLNDGETPDQNDGETPDQRIDPKHPSHVDLADQHVDIPTEPIHADIPVEPIQQTEPHRSSRVPQPSASSLQSKEYRQREEIGRKKDEDWTTN
jgi:hypothetical protein